MKKELKDVNVKINAKEFSDWFKKHFKNANEDIVCDMLKIVDMSEINGSMIDFSKITTLNEDLSNWDVS